MKAVESLFYIYIKNCPDTSVVTMLPYGEYAFEESSATQVEKLTKVLALESSNAYQSP